MNAKDLSEADHKFRWNQKKVVDKESRLVISKMKETINSLKYPFRISRISYTLPEI